MMVEKQTAVGDREPTRTLLPAPRCEVALYALLVLFTLATRIAGLGRFALTDRELAGTVAVLSWLDGDALSGLAYSPLQWLLQLPLLALTRSGELAVRLPGALAAAALTVGIYGQRHRLGRGRALALAVLAATSPTLLHFSRQADGAFLSAAAGLMATLWGYCALQTRTVRDWCWLAVFVAVGLTAGPGFWTWLLAAAMAVAWRASNARDLAARAPGGERLALKRPLVWGMLTLVGISTVLLTHLGGFGAVLNLASEWFRGLATPQEPWYWLPYNLVLYEPLLLALGIAGAMWALRRRDGLGLFALGWLGVALLLGLVGHRNSFWLADTVAPLLLLAAGGVAPLWEALRAGRGANTIVAAVCLAILLAFDAINLLMFAHTNQAPFAWLAAGAAVVIVGLWAGFWLWEGRVAALSVGIALLLAVLGATTVRTAVAVGYQTARDPHEPLVYDPVVLDPQQWREFLETTSLREAGDLRTLDVVWAPALDLEARWYLREMHDAAPMTPDNWATAEALYVMPTVDEGPPAGYVGQRLVWRKSWSGEGLPVADRLRWLLLRQPVGWEQEETIALWFRFDR